MCCWLWMQGEPSSALSVLDVAVEKVRCQTCITRHVPLSLMQRPFANLQIQD